MSSVMPADMRMMI